MAENSAGPTLHLIDNRMSQYEFICHLSISFDYKGKFLTNCSVGNLDTNDFPFKKFVYINSFKFSFTNLLFSKNYFLNGFNE